MWVVQLPRFFLEKSLNPYRDFNIWVNSFIFSENFVMQAKETLGEESAYYSLCYLRDLVGGTLVYWLTAGVWHVLIYVIFVNEIFHKRDRPLPTWGTIVDQILLSQFSLFIYAGLPVISEYLIENNMTMVYFYVEDIGGWANYFACLAAYLFCVEFGIYWMHRTLHTNKFLYKYIHALHHKYNKPLTLTPWASIAFNPLDGILQASPYVFFLLCVPVHYFTHVFLLFFSGVWATNIHDAVWGDTEPIMGAKYHTMHHTHYHVNFGQFFIFWDWVYGTLKSPDRDLVEGKKGASSKDLPNLPAEDKKTIDVSSNKCESLKVE